MGIQINGRPLDTEQSLAFERALADFQAAVWKAACEEGIDYDLAGLEESKKVIALYRESHPLPVVEP
jgi:hypothetical protein